MRKRKAFFRIRKKAANRWLVEERHTFLFFWRFYVKGSIKVPLPKYFASPALAQDAINKACKKKNIIPFVVVL